LKLAKSFRHSVVFESDLRVTVVVSDNALSLKKGLETAPIRSHHSLIDRDWPGHLYPFTDDELRTARVEMSEDDLKGFEKKVQDLTDKYVAEVHEVQRKKDAELMEI